LHFEQTRLLFFEGTTIVDGLVNRAITHGKHDGRYE